MVYCISYDLRSPGRDYESLINAIKSYRVWWHQTESVWLVVTSQTAKEVRDTLMKQIDRFDKLFVVALNREWAGVGFEEKEYFWLKSISQEGWE